MTNSSEQPVGGTRLLGRLVQRAFGAVGAHQVARELTARVISAHEATIATSSPSTMPPGSSAFPSPINPVSLEAGEVQGSPGDSRRSTAGDSRDRRHRIS